MNVLKNISKKPEIIYKCSTTESAFGEYYLKVNQHDKARDYFLSAISLEPNEVRNYLLMGDSYLNEFRYETAEQWYTDALNINFLEMRGNLSQINFIVRLSRVFQIKS